MVDEAEKEAAAKIAPASKSQLLEWIKTASDLISKNTQSVKKSFESLTTMIKEMIQHMLT